MDVCSKHGTPLADDGGCEKCWIENFDKQSAEISRSNAEFFAWLKRQYAIEWEEEYVAYANAIHAILGVYPTFKEYVRMRIQKEWEDHTDRSGGR